MLPAQPKLLLVSDEEFLRHGAGVITTRGEVHYVVTEHGVTYLHGKSVRERAMALISIAHPRFREQLFRQALAAKVPAPRTGRSRRPGAADLGGDADLHPAQRRHPSFFPAGAPHRRTTYEGPALRPVPGDPVLSFHVHQWPFRSQGDPELRLHRPPQGRRHRRHHTRKPTARTSSPWAGTIST